MAEPTVIPGGYFNLMVSDGQDPPTYTYVCGITSNELTEAVNSNDQFVPDCDDPEKLMDRHVVVISKQLDATISGTYNPDNFEDIQALIGVSAPYKIMAGVTAAMVTAGYTPTFVTGNFVLKGMTLGGTRSDGGFINLTGATLSNDGPYEWTFGSKPA